MTNNNIDVIFEIFENMLKIITHFEIIIDSNKVNKLTKPDVNKYLMNTDKTKIKKLIIMLFSFFFTKKYNKIPTGTLGCKYSISETNRNIISEYNNSIIKKLYKVNPKTQSEYIYKDDNKFSKIVSKIYNICKKNKRITNVNSFLNNIEKNKKKRFYYGTFCKGKYDIVVKSFTKRNKYKFQSIKDKFKFQLCNPNKTKSNKCLSTSSTVVF